MVDFFRVVKITLLLGFVLGAFIIGSRVEAQTNDWTVEYFNLPNTNEYLVEPPTFSKDDTRTPDAVTSVASIEANIGEAAPFPGINPDRFVARYTKTVDAYRDGTYYYRTLSDDGVQVYVDDELVLDEWNDHSEKYNFERFDTTAGEHTITVLYYDNGYDSVIDMSDIRFFRSAPGEDFAVLQTSEQSNQHISDDYVFSAAMYHDNDFEHCERFIDGTTDSCPNRIVYQTGDLLLTVEVKDQDGAVAASYTDIPRSISEPFVSSSPYAPAEFQIPFAGFADGVYSVEAILTHSNGSQDTLSVTGLHKGSAVTSDEMWSAEYWNLDNQDMYLLSPPTIPQTIADATSSYTAVDFDWAEAAPIDGIGEDRFVARFSKTVDLAKDGDYTMTTHSDDGVRVYLDGTLWINEWNDHSATEHSATGFASAGMHEVVVEYYENGFDSVVSFEMTAEEDSVVTTPVVGDYADAVATCNSFGDGALVYMHNTQLTSTNPASDVIDTGFSVNAGYSSPNIGPFTAYAVSYDDHSNVANDGANESWTVEANMGGPTDWMATADIPAGENIGVSMINPYINRAQYSYYDPKNVEYTFTSSIATAADAVTAVCVVLTPFDESMTPVLTAELVLNGYDTPRDRFNFGSVTAYKQPNYRLFSLTPTQPTAVVGLPSYNVGPGGTTVFLEDYIGNSLEEMERNYPHLEQTSTFDLTQYELVSVGGENCTDGNFELAFATDTTPVQNAHCEITINYLGDKEQAFVDDFDYDNYQAHGWTKTSWGGAESEQRIIAGNWGRALQNTATLSGPDAGVRSISPEISVDETKLYDLSFDFRNTKNNEVLIAEHDVNGDVLEYNWVGNAGFASGWWGRFDAEYTPSAGTTSVQIYIDLKNEDGTMSFDNVVLSTNE